MPQIPDGLNHVDLDPGAASERDTFRFSPHVFLEVVVLAE